MAASLEVNPAWIKIEAERFIDTGRGAQSSSGVRQTLWAVVPESCDGARG